MLRPCALAQSIHQSPSKKNCLQPRKVVEEFIYKGTIYKMLLEYGGTTKDSTVTQG